MEIKITKDNFESAVLKAEQPVVLDFWATWCGPCKMIAPVLAELAEKHGDRLTVGKINVDEQVELAARYQIASIPTILLVKNGEIAAKAVGYQPLSGLEKWLRGAGVLD